MVVVRACSIFIFSIISIASEWSHRKHEWI